jgi:hypothetical protein
MVGEIVGFDFKIKSMEVLVYGNFNQNKLFQKFKKNNLNQLKIPIINIISQGICLEQTTSSIVIVPNQNSLFVSPSNFNDLNFRQEENPFRRF